VPTVPGPFPMERTGRFPLAPDCSGPEGISPYGGVTVPDVHASTQEERNGHDDQ